MKTPEELGLIPLDEEVSTPESLGLIPIDEQGNDIPLVTPEQARQRAVPRYSDQFRYPGGPRAMTPPPSPDWLQRGIAYLHPESSAARQTALQQMGLPQQAGFGQEMAAEMVGELPTTTGAMLGAAAGAPFGPIGMGAGLLAGAGISSLYRQLAAQQAAGEDLALREAVPPMIRDMAFELGGAGAGAAVGRVGQAISQRLRAPGTGPYAAGLRTTREMPPGDLERAANNYQTARQLQRETGIDYPLTPGELLDDPFMKDRERTMVLFPEIGRAVRGTLDARAMAAVDMGRQFAAGLSPGRRVTTHTGYAALPDIGKQIVDFKRTERRELTRPLYRAVLENSPAVNVQKLVTNLTNRRRKAEGAARDEFDTVLNRISQLTDSAGNVSPRALHELQYAYSDRARSLDVRSKAGQDVLSGIQKPIQRTLMDANPDYKRVSQMYGERSADLERFEQTRLGLAGRARPEEYFEKGRTFFRRHSQPEDIRNLRESLLKEVRSMHKQSGGAMRAFNDVWQGVKTAFIYDKLAAKPRQSGAAPNVPGIYYQALGGLVDDAGGMVETDQLRALLSDREFAHLQGILDAFKKTSEMFSFGSATAPRLEAANLAEQAGIETALGGTPALTNMLIRAAPGLASQFMTGGMDAARLHADAIVGGLDASMDQIRRLNRDLQRLRLKPPIDMEDAIARAWGQVIGETGRSAVRAERQNEPAVSAFAGGA